MITEAHTAILTFFYQKTGICFDEKRDIVANKIDAFAHQYDFSDMYRFLDELRKNEILLQAFTNMLTVNETYFFRESAQISMLIERAKQKSSFSIICAPCSSGEELYSILIALEEAKLLTRLERIVGIDINSDVVEAAKQGSFSQRSVHKLSSQLKERYFRQEGTRYIIVDSLKQKATFRVENIFSADIMKLGTFDFVFSRNMLIYFDTESRKKASTALCHLLASEGTLFVGHADILETTCPLKKRVENGIISYAR